eukprot:maker-scaffold171_size289870-snap-gene-1.37 protein:Tk00431 transcript:maker-scaffold171_size289870-snap-gene-1.37-mRNA-1 annotation:"hypothetical protein CAPTEDRAFT_193384"
MNKSWATCFLWVICLVNSSVWGQELGRKLFLVGGGLADDNDVLYSKFVELAGGSGNAQIGIVTGASADPQDSADFYLQQFLDYGAVSTYFVPVYEGNEGGAIDEQVVQEIQSLTGIFFGGGDQTRLTALLYTISGGDRVETPVMTAIREVYESGAAVVGGTSAGAAVMSGGVMVSGGMSYDALAYGSSTDSEYEDDLTYEAAGGMGLAAGLVVDTHFSQRGREGRMIRLLSDTKDIPMGTNNGAGIDENTAFIVTSDLNGQNRRAEVLGENGVFLVDVGSSHVQEINDVWTIDTVYADFLEEGDIFDLEAWSLIDVAAYKSDLVGQEAWAEAETSTDIFYGNREDPDLPPVLTRVATSLFDARADSTWGKTGEKRPQFQLNFIKGQYSVGYGGVHPSSGQFGVSYQDLIIDIVALNDVARSITGAKRQDHVRIPDLLAKAGIPSLNSIAVRAVAMEAWKAYHSCDGPNGTRNPIGNLLFSNNCERGTRAATGGAIPLPLISKADTFVWHATTIWNGSKDLREAPTKGAAMKSLRGNVFNLCKMLKETNPSALIAEFGGSKVWTYNATTKALFCQLCMISIDIKKKSSIKQHVFTEKHKRGIERETD